MLNLNGQKWIIDSLGKNVLFFYVSITDETSSIDYTIDASLIDATLPILPQIYDWILSQPDFAGGNLITTDNLLN